ncbi:uncharacterized protein EV422DRAFT_242205 [Fimicolochytrium jonesii]|uniref:uncharacterized protein n=1 Tax=Fimicolochytrium jonesii TaxID=1396493 RepID=UPI0022FEBD8C|nr:uncharacterized protein EV422DRAFT_242205 [Fimicolochytrium jonesii]KAI8825016.1 hypothetical protein EV422DRAFT_242205 [Fimicolochytrium jonesii]
MEPANEAKVDPTSKAAPAAVDMNDVTSPRSSARHGKSYQVRALGRKTLAYQKRQLFTNICCVACCPLLMVVLSAALGKVIQNLVDKSTAPRDIIYCSSVVALDDSNFPLQNVSDPLLPSTPPMINGNKILGTSEDLVYHANFLVGPTQNGPPSAGSLVGNAPCVRYFGTGYSYRTGDPYATDPQVAASANYATYDSTYSPEPRGGWLSPTVATKLARYLFQYELRPWAFVSQSSSVTNAGSREQGPLIPITPALSTFTPLKPATAANGLLDTIESRLYVNATTTGGNLNLAGVESVPFFQNVGSDINLALGTAIRNAVDRLSTIDKSIFFESDPDPDTVSKFLVDVSGVTNSVPYGALHLDTIDHAAKKYKYTMQIGKDKRFEAAAGYPTAGLRQVLQQAQLNGAILRTSNPGTYGAAAITASTRAFPIVQSTRLDIPFSSFIGRILFPFGVSFLTPFFVVTLVKEKEDRIMGMMRMNGLKVWTYWLAHYIHFYSLHILSAAVFLIVGAAVKMSMFTKTSPGVLILVLFIWGHAQVALSFLLGALFGTSRTGLVVTFLIILCSVLVSLAGDSLFVDQAAPSGYFVWPPFAFYRILTVLNRTSFQKTERPYTISRIRPGDEVFTAIMFMIWEWFVLMALAIWLGNGGWSKLVFATKHRLANRRKQNDLGKQVTDEEAQQPPENYTSHEDADVTAERARVTALAEHNSNPLILKDLQKTYATTGKKALKTLTLAVESDLVFGLLGPNGAGKSTTISILTGLYDATGGKAYIAGYDIYSEQEDVWRVVGICPQHDILWDDLTCEEHLLFYARLKGISPSEEKKVVEESLRTVALHGAFKNRLSKGLSGGEKRRLSIAIALVGHPKVVFLDEPTTGLDPEVRRLIWDIIQQARIGKTIILTTHSMEEAEVLCQRIGIMSQGTLRCLGSPLRLKQLYANSFRLSFSSTSEDTMPAATQFVESQVLPSGGEWQRDESFASQATYSFPKDDDRLPVSKVFEIMQEHAELHGISEYGIGETTLEEVFVRIIGADGEEASAE